MTRTVQLSPLMNGSIVNYVHDEAYTETTPSHYFPKHRYRLTIKLTHITNYNLPECIT